MSSPVDLTAVAGFSRSGTTLVAALAAEERNAVALPELHFFDELLPAAGLRPGLSGDVSLEAVSARLGATYSTKLSVSPGLAEEVRSRLAQQIDPIPVSTAYAQLCTAVGRCIAGGEVSGVVEKTPINWRYAHLILSDLAAAELIVVHRNPVRVWKSYDSSGMNPIPLDKFDREWAKSALAITAVSRRFPERVRMVSYHQAATQSADRVVEAQDSIATASEPWKARPDRSRIDENIIAEGNEISSADFPYSSQVGPALGYRGRERQPSLLTLMARQRLAGSVIGCRMGWLLRSVVRRVGALTAGDVPPSRRLRTVLGAVRPRKRKGSLNR